LSALTGEEAGVRWVAVEAIAATICIGAARGSARLTDAEVPFIAIGEDSVIAGPT